MGQIEVYEFLKTQRLKGDDDYFSAKNIYDGLKAQAIDPVSKTCLYAALIQLERFDYVEVKMSGKFRDWHRLYRLKKKYCLESPLEDAA